MQNPCCEILSSQLRNQVLRQICPTHGIQSTRERSFHKIYRSSLNNLPWSLALMEVKVKDCNCTLRNEHFSALCPEASHSNSFTPVRYETSWAIWPDPSDHMEHAVAAPCRHNGFSCGQEKVPHIWQFLLERVAVSASASVIQYAGFPDCQNQFNMQHAPKICESARSQSHQKSRLHLQHEKSRLHLTAVTCFHSIGIFDSNWSLWPMSTVAARKIWHFFQVDLHFEKWVCWWEGWRGWNPRSLPNLLHLRITATQLKQLSCT